MGCATEQDPDCALDEQPQHAVELPAYAIDVFEVKASSYGDCVEAGVCEGVTDATCFWGTTTVGVGGEGEHPANCVPWGAARAYCQWAGGDLCAESQWEKAARGSCALAGLEGDDCASALPRYVWGDTPLLELAHPPGNYSDKTAFEAGAWLDWFHMLDYDDGHVTTAPVGSFPAGASPYGALDMGGNVWEWVLDCGTDSYEGAPADGSAVMPDDCTMRVARGASFDAVNPWLRVTERGGDAPDHVGQDTGFRCCY
jgi:formylglycine-generating enzyme required for sulfatase activity